MEEVIDGQLLGRNHLWASVLPFLAAEYFGEEVVSQLHSYVWKDGKPIAATETVIPESLYNFERKMWDLIALAQDYLRKNRNRLPQGIFGEKMDAVKAIRILFWSTIKLNHPLIMDVETYIGIREDYRIVSLPESENQMAGLLKLGG